jgi:hypothetical protein
MGKDLGRKWENGDVISIDVPKARGKTGTPRRSRSAIRLSCSAIDVGEMFSNVPMHGPTMWAARSDPRGFVADTTAPPREWPMRRISNGSVYRRSESDSWYIQVSIDGILKRESPARTIVMRRSSS